MVKHPEHEEKNTASDSRKQSDSKAVAVSISPSKSAIVLLKLKLVANYAMYASPVLAVLALIVGTFSLAGNLSTREQLGVAATRLESLNTSLSASKDELEKLKAAIAQGKAMQEEERKKQDELVSEIIRNVTNLQIRMKIYPTLEEQLIQHASTTPAAQSAVNVTSARAGE